MGNKIIKQFNLLFVNNLRYIKRNYYSYFISPIIYIVISFLIILILNTLIHKESVYGKEELFKPFIINSEQNKKSKNKYDINLNSCFKENCSDVFIYIIGKKDKPNWVSNSIKRIKKEFKKTKLQFQSEHLKDVKKKFLKDRENYIFKNFVVFCYQEKENLPMYDFNCNKDPKYSNQFDSYFLGYNNTNYEFNIVNDLTAPKSVDYNVVYLKNIIDEEILKIELENPNFKFNLTYMEFPKPKLNSFKNYDAYSTESLFYFAIICILLSNKYIKIKGKEKELQIRKRLYIFGLSDISYFLNEIIYILAKNVYQSILFLIIGIIFQSSIFFNTNFVIHFFIFFTFLNSLDFFGLFIITLFNDTKKAMKIMYIIILFSIFLIIFLKNEMLIKLLWTTNISDFLIFLRIVFIFFPTFSFCSIYFNIENIASNKLDFKKFLVMDGKNYSYNEYYDSKSGIIFGKDFNIPSDFNLVLILISLGIFYFILVVILDNLLFENKGRIYTFKKRKINDKEELLLENEELEDDKDYLIIKNVSKTYKKYFGIKKIKALKNVNLKIPLNSVYGLLGENGAGKSTLITLLSGLTPPDEGEIYIIKKNRKKIYLNSKIISICQQTNILYPDLTVFENLLLFLKLKLLLENKILDYKEMKKQIDTLISYLCLEDKKNNLIKELSGGMQRRVSALVAFLGYPEIVILDEPSAGLDPVNRKILLEFILKMKKEKNITVIISSHIMEEIQRMSDFIGIIHEGNKVTENTLNNIRNNKGKILIVNLNIDKVSRKSRLSSSILFKKNLNKEIINLILKLGNNLKVIYNSEKYIKFFIPEIKENLNLVKELEKKENDEIKKYVYSISLGTNTLEECFFKLIKNFKKNKKT